MLRTIQKHKHLFVVVFILFARSSLPQSIQYINLTLSRNTETSSGTVHCCTMPFRAVCAVQVFLVVLSMHVCDRRTDRPTDRMLKHLDGWFRFIPFCIILFFSSFFCFGFGFVFVFMNSLLYVYFLMVVVVVDFSFRLVVDFVVNILPHCVVAIK